MCILEDHSELGDDGIGEEDFRSWCAERGVAEWDTGSRYLGSGLGGREFRSWYVRSKTEKWEASLNFLVEVARVDPQVGYALLTQGLIPRWRFLMRTTETEPEWFERMEEIIRGPLTGAIIGKFAEGDLRERLGLPCRHGGMGIPDPRQLSRSEFNASRRVTCALVELIEEVERRKDGPTK